MITIEPPKNFVIVGTTFLHPRLPSDSVAVVAKKEDKKLFDKYRAPCGKGKSKKDWT